MRALKTVGATLLILLWATLGMTANLCVSPAGSGTKSGADWDNALDWAGVTSTNITRGDVIYLADSDGTKYTSKQFSEPVSGTTLVTIAKATASAHGTDTGWVSTMGDGVAEIEGTTPTLRFSSDYWLLDGVVGSGTTGHGIKVTTTSTTSASKLCTIDVNVDHITLEHIEFQHCGMDKVLNQDCIYANGTGGSITYLTVRNCYLHDVTRVHVLAYVVTNSLFENNVFAYRHDNTVHGESMSFVNCGATAADTLRYNTFYNIYGTGYVCVMDSDQGGFLIHSNLFYSSDTARYIATNGLICNTGGDNNSNMLVYFNTVYNVKGYGSGRLYLTAWQGTGTGNVTENNLVYGCGAVGLTGTNTYDYNASDDVSDASFTAANNVTITTDPFVSKSTADFRIVAGADVVAQGLAIAGITTDFAGVTRADPPTIGAYAAQSGEAPLPPNAATALTGTIRATFSPNMSFTDNSSDETGFKVKVNGTLITTLAANTTSFTLSNLTPGTLYTVTVEATKTGATGDAAPATYTFTTPSFRRLR